MNLARTAVVRELNDKPNNVLTTSPTSLHVGLHAVIINNNDFSGMINRLIDCWTY